VCGTNEVELSVVLWVLQDFICIFEAAFSGPNLGFDVSAEVLVSGDPHKRLS